MGQKVNPVGLRLGYVKGWDSNWYGGKDFSDKLVEDEKIRKYIAARIPNPRAGISKVIIERTLKRITLTINTSRPGVVIGKNGAEVDKVKEELKKITNKDVQINIFEIKRPEIDAKLVGEAIAQQLQNRVSYRKAMKQAISNAMRIGAQGIKIKLGGRLGGAEIARNESYKEGRIPLQTLRADIDYALSEAHTVYGVIGIKVWVFRGEVYGRRELTPNADQAAAAKNAGGARRNDRPGRGDRNERGGRDDKRGGGRGGNNNRRRGGNDRGGRGAGRAE